MASGVTTNYPRLYACPTPPESLAFPTYWYRLPNDDDFLICTKCFEDKLRTTLFGSLLRYDYLDYGPRADTTCDFNTPRIDSLLRQAVASNNFESLLLFTENRLRIKSCPGTHAVKGDSGVKWFSLSQDVVPGFICCEACYEDVALGTVFGREFISYREQPMDASWSCDLAVPYLRQGLVEFAARRDWHGFTEACRHRISLPECESGVPTPAMLKNWYNTVRPSPIPDMTACEACYLDRVGWQNVARNFSQITFSPYEVGPRLLCDFKLAPMAACADILLVHGAFKKWHHFASLVASKPLCSKEGIVDGEWYGLVGSNNATVANFDLCAACHAGWNQSTDYGHLFRRLNYPSGTTRVCDFNPSAPRYTQWIGTWNQMYFTRNPAPFIDYVSRLAPLPQCQGINRLKNEKWYANEKSSLLICPSCFQEAVHATYFVSSFELQTLPGEHRCSLYSPRMRGLYAEACKQQSLDLLLEFTARREEIYQQTIPQLSTLAAAQTPKLEILKLAHQQRANQTAITSLGRGFMGGNPIVTPFDPAVMLSTITYRAQLAAWEKDPERLRMRQLEAKWKEVE